MSWYMVNDFMHIHTHSHVHTHTHTHTMYMHGYIDHYCGKGHQGQSKACMYGASQLTMKVKVDYGKPIFFSSRYKEEFHVCDLVL